MNISARRYPITPMAPQTNRPLSIATAKDRQPQKYSVAKVAPTCATPFTEGPASRAANTSRTVTATYHQVTTALSGPFPQIAATLDAAGPDLAAFAAMPAEHWHKIWPNNPIERVNREIKRRCDVVQIFPDRPSAAGLVGAVLIDQREERQHGQRHHLSETSMRRLIHTLTSHQPDNPATPPLAASKNTAPGDLTLSLRRALEREWVASW